MSRNNKGLLWLAFMFGREVFLNYYPLTRQTACKINQSPLCLSLIFWHCFVLFCSGRHTSFQWRYHFYYLHCTCVCYSWFRPLYMYVCTCVIFAFWMVWEFLRYAGQISWSPMRISLNLWVSPYEQTALKLHFSLWFPILAIFGEKCLDNSYIFVFRTVPTVQCAHVLRNMEYMIGINSINYAIKIKAKIFLPWLNEPVLN